MTEVRRLRRAINLSQREFADLMGVPWNTFRMWDSGLRRVPLDMLRRANLVTTRTVRNSELLSLDHLALELGIKLALQDDPRVRFLPEPRGLAPLWITLSKRNDKSHLLWTDDYLAAFAQARRPGS